MQAWLFHPLSDSPKFTFPKALYVDKTQIVFYCSYHFYRHAISQYVTTYYPRTSVPLFFCLPTIYTNLDYIDLKQATFTKLKLNTSKLFAQIDFHFQNSETLLIESRPIVIFFLEMTGWNVLPYWTGWFLELTLWFDALVPLEVLNLLFGTCHRFSPGGREGGGGSVDFGCVMIKFTR